jgi:hypothetical protein
MEFWMQKQEPNRGYTLGGSSLESRLPLVNCRNKNVINLDQPRTLNARAPAWDPCAWGTWFHCAKEQPSVMSCKTEAGGSVHGKVESSEINAFLKSLKVQVWGHVDSGHIVFANHEFQNAVQRA